MPKYIDVEKILNFPIRADHCDKHANPHFIYGIETVMEYIENLAKNEPIDVQEVRHGEWDEIRDAYGHLEGWIHRDCGRMSMAKENYCPNCGAKMR